MNTHSTHTHTHTHTHTAQADSTAWVSYLFAGSMSSQGRHQVWDLDGQGEGTELLLGTNSDSGRAVARQRRGREMKGKEGRREIKSEGKGGREGGRVKEGVFQY